MQHELSSEIQLTNSFNIKDIQYCAGVDVAYWWEDNVEWGVCCIVVIHYQSGEMIEEVYAKARVYHQYIPGLLGLREIPLIVKAAKSLKSEPDIFMFDGNGYLHPHHMGVATHASFFLNKPTIGIAKKYLKINGVEYKMPINKAGAYENVTIENEIYGRVLRAHKNVKPIFISSGNYIDLQTATKITLDMINEESRLPIPVRKADQMTRILKRQMAWN